MPSRYDLRANSLPPYRTFGQRADEVAGLLGGLGRGAGYTALDLFGTASDLGLTVTDLLGVTDPAVPRAQMIGTGDWLVDRAADLGLVQPRTGEGAETAGRFLGQVAIPGVSPAEMAGWAKVLPFLLGTFKGMNANLSDDETRMLQKAYELEQQGLGREAIRQATNPPGGSGGWFRSPADKKWRMEVDDSGALINASGPEGARVSNAIPLGGDPALDIGPGGLLDHPELWRAYDKSDVAAHTYVSPSMTMLGSDRGKFDPTTRSMTYFAPQSVDVARSTGLHEIQHGIQGVEGFARGGLPKEFAEEAANGMRRAMEELNGLLAQGGAKSDNLPSPNDIDIGGMSPWKIGSLYERQELTRYLPDDLIPEYEARLGDLQKAIEQTDTQQKYLSLAGEAEARLVQARRDLTPAQRAALDPIEQMDTMLKQEGILGGLDDLIVRYGDGPAMSRKMTRKLADEITGKDPRLDDIRAAMRELDAREQALWDRFPAPNPGSQGLLSGSRLDAIEAQERARQAVMGSADYADIQSSRNALSKRMAKERKKIADEIYQQSKSQPIIAPWLLLGGTGALGAGLLGSRGYD